MNSAQKDILKYPEGENARIILNLFNNLPQKIFYKDKDLNYLFCNENYARDLKIKSSEIQGKSDFDFYPKELAEKYRADDVHVLKSDETKEVEESYVIEGKEYWVQTVKTPIREGGQVIGVLGVFWDITDRKILEAQKQESEARLNSIIQSTADGVIAVDEQGKISLWNKGSKKMFGFTQKEMIGKPLSYIMPEHFTKGHKEGMKRVLSGGEKHVIGHPPVELAGLNKEGKEFPIELTLSQWTLGSKKFFTGIIRDITQRKEIENKLAEEAEEVGKMNKLMVGRELKMIELKERIAELEKKKS